MPKLIIVFLSAGSYLPHVPPLELFCASHGVWPRENYRVPSFRPRYPRNFDGKPATLEKLFIATYDTGWTCLYAKQTFHGAQLLGDVYFPVRRLFRIIIFIR